MGYILILYNYLFTIPVQFMTFAALFLLLSHSSDAAV
jgi:hypothetical protein